MAKIVYSCNDRREYFVKLPTKINMALVNSWGMNGPLFNITI